VRNAGTIVASAIAAFVAAAAIAWAADNAVIITAGSGVTMSSKDVGSGVQSMKNILWDGTNIATVTAGGSLNAFITNANANGRATAPNSSPVVDVAAASTAGAIVPNNTTAVVVKASAGTLFGVQVYGIGAAAAFLKIYNAASATCGSGTPVKRLMIPSATGGGAGSNVAFGPGLAFSTGITYCVTTGIADADTTAPAASTFLVNLDYE
jgi:hypothetical protein